MATTQRCSPCWGQGYILNGDGCPETCETCGGQGYIEEKAWDDRIEEAKSRGGFTAADRNAAKGWQTCAVGERFDIPESGPKSADLQEHGRTFHQQVNENDVTGAEETKRKIDNR